MLSFFPCAEITGLRKYTGCNGVLVAEQYDPTKFHAHFLACIRNKKINSISFSCLLPGKYRDAIFTLTFSEDKKLQLTFNAANIYFNSDFIKINQKDHDEMEKNIVLLQDTLLNLKDADPMSLLDNLGSCVFDQRDNLISHSNVKITSFEENYTRNIKPFIISLTNIFKDELKNLKENSQEKKTQSKSLSN